MRKEANILSIVANNFLLCSALICPEILIAQFKFGSLFSKREMNFNFTDPSPNDIQKRLKDYYGETSESQKP